MINQGYSKKSKQLAHERLVHLKEHNKEVLRERKQKTKELSKQTNAIRRKLEDRKQSKEEEEEERRQKILKSRKLKQQLATEKFQRFSDQPKPKERFKRQGSKNGLRDGQYNVRGHLIEIRNGIRVSSVKKDDIIEEKQNTTPIFQNSVYKPNSYLSSHLNNLLADDVFRQPADKYPDNPPPDIIEDWTQRYVTSQNNTPQVIPDRNVYNTPQVNPDRNVYNAPQVNPDRNVYNTPQVNPDRNVYNTLQMNPDRNLYNTQQVNPDKNVNSTPQVNPDRKIYNTPQMNSDRNVYANEGEHIIISPQRSSPESACSNDSLNGQKDNLRSSLKGKSIRNIIDTHERKVTFSGSIEFNDGRTEPLQAKMTERIPLYKRIQNNTSSTENNINEKVPSTEDMLDQLRQEVLLPKYPVNGDYSYPDSIGTDQCNNVAVVTPLVLPASDNTKTQTSVKDPSKPELAESTSSSYVIDDSLNSLSTKDSLHAADNLIDSLAEDTETNSNTEEHTTAVTSVHNAPIINHAIKAEVNSRKHTPGSYPSSILSHPVSSNGTTTIANTRPTVTMSNIQNYSTAYIETFSNRNIKNCTEHVLETYPQATNQNGGESHNNIDNSMDHLIYNNPVKEMDGYNATKEDGITDADSATFNGAHYNSNQSLSYISQPFHRQTFNQYLTAQPQLKNNHILNGFPITPLQANSNQSVSNHINNGYPITSLQANSNQSVSNHINNGYPITSLQANSNQSVANHVNNINSNQPFIYNPSVHPIHPSYQFSPGKADNFNSPSSLNQTYQSAYNSQSHTIRNQYLIQQNAYKGNTQPSHGYNVETSQPQVRHNSEAVQNVSSKSQPNHQQTKTYANIRSNRENSKENFSHDALRDNSSSKSLTKSKHQMLELKRDISKDQPNISKQASSVTDDIYNEVERSLAGLTFENSRKIANDEKLDLRPTIAPHGNITDEPIVLEQRQYIDETSTDTNKISDAIRDGTSIPIRVHPTPTRRGRVIVSANSKRKKQVSAFAPHPPPNPKSNNVASEKHENKNIKETDTSIILPEKHEHVINISKRRPVHQRASSANAIVSQKPPHLSKQRPYSHIVRGGSSKVHENTTSDFYRAPVTKHQGYMNNENDLSNINIAKQIALNKTPTDDEINKLWANVRECLSSETSNHAYSDSMCIVDRNPYKYHQRTFSGSSFNRRSVYKPQYYRQTSSDSLSSGSSFTKRQSLLPQRASKVIQHSAVSSNDDRYGKRGYIDRVIKQSGNVMDKYKDVTSSMASFLALEELCAKQSLSPRQTEAVFQASKQHMNKKQQGMTALSIEERTVMESLDRLNERLNEQERGGMNIYDHSNNMKNIRTDYR